jgi:hypothetical protein
LDLIETLSPIWGFDYREDLLAAREAMNQFLEEDE